MQAPSPVTPTPPRPIPPAIRPAIRLASAVGFASLIALCAQLAVPMVPAPMTMQTWAVLLAGIALGPAWGVAAVLLYLVAGLIGLPVLSEGASGVGPFTGPTAGYLMAFVPAAGLAGWLSRRGSLERNLTAVGWMVGIHLLVLAAGGAWLAVSIGVGPALGNGVLPFLPGAVLKSLLAVAAARGLDRLNGWPNRFRRA